MKCSFIPREDSNESYVVLAMTKLQIGSLLILIIFVCEGVESLLSTRKLWRHHAREYNLRVPTERPYGLRCLKLYSHSMVSSRYLMLSARCNSQLNCVGGESYFGKNDEPIIACNEQKSINERSTREDPFKKDIKEKRTTDSQPTSRRNNFSREKRWLEDATDKLLDLSILPLGSLSQDDVVSITSLMIEWSRRRSFEGVMAIERLLKRVIDDMRAGNLDIQVSTRMYIIVIEAWGKSDETAGAERAQSIHDALVQTYRQTKNPLIKPTTKSYNTLILAWAKSKNPSAQLAAEKALREMLTESGAIMSLRPDAITYGSMLYIYARANGEGSVAKAERLVRSMSGFKVTKTTYVYSSLQEVYLSHRSGEKDAATKIMAVLKKMIDEYSEGNRSARPNVSNFNNVLCAYSRTPSKNIALRAIDMLDRIEKPAEEGGYDVIPDRLSYFLTILVCSRCSNQTFGANLAEQILRRMEERSIAEAKKRKELSIAAPPLVSLDIECFNVVLSALSKSRDLNAIDRIFDIISRMEKYAEEGQEHLRPNTRSFNSALNALSNKKTLNAAKRAENTLNRMFQLHSNGKPNVKPNGFSYTAILKCYQVLGTTKAAQKSNDILWRMEELYEKQILDYPPDIFHYTIVCSAWSASRSKIAADKCIEILSHMKEKDNEGWPRVRPNIRTYNAVLDCLSRSFQANKAEQLLYHMLSLAKGGDVGARPDAFSFCAVINGFIHSKMPDAGRRAESVLERGLEYAEEDDGEMLDMKSFTSILGYYGRQSKAIDSPYRAQYLLNRLVSLYKDGFSHLSPHVSCFTNVMDAYATQHHRDAGEIAEGILKNMLKLQKYYNASNVEVNTGVMNQVLNCWAESVGHDGAGGRAEHLLDLMENKMEKQNDSMAPNSRSYNLVIRTWLKSKSSDKAEKAFCILQRAKKSYPQQKPNALVNEYTYSLVIQACASSDNADPKIAMRAFKIAVDVMDELICDVPARTEPSSATYGWFFRVCARLRVPEPSKEREIRRLFSRCCERSRVNEFVLQSLKQATSDALFNAILTENLETPMSFNPKEIVQLSHLPKSWIDIDCRTHSRSKTSKKVASAKQQR